MSIFGLLREGMAGFVMVYTLTMYVAVIAFSVINYILQSVSFYSIAKRRGIYNPWLSWVPVGNVWVLGCVSDQYRYVTKGDQCKRRRKLLGLSIAVYAMIFPVTAGVVMMALAENADAMIAGVAIGITVLGYVAMVILAIILTVQQYIALYDVYASCQPKRAIVYLLLSIFIGITLPFFLFSCRNKDLGMIPQAPAQPVEPDQT